MKKFTRKLEKYLCHKPVSLHIDYMGLLRLASSNEKRIEKFCELLNGVSEFSTLLIPTYSYSYTQRKAYDLLNSPSEVGYVTEELRKKTPYLRTVDPLFSYLVMGSMNDKHFIPSDYESFGSDSLISEFFDRDGYLWAVGGVLHQFTEIHYLEKLLNIPYRMDKEFSGEIIDAKGKKHIQKTIFFCRNLSFPLQASFLKLAVDLREKKLVDTIVADDFDFKIESIRMKFLFEFIQEKMRIDPLYLCIEKK